MGQGGIHNNVNKLFVPQNSVLGLQWSDQSLINLLARAVSQHTDTSKNTKAWAVSQHTDTIKNTKATLKYCYALHSYMEIIYSLAKLLAQHPSSRNGDKSSEDGVLVAVHVVG